MGMAAYAVIGGGGEWRIRHDGKSENVYQTKESVFEAAVAAASLAMKQGHEIQIAFPAAKRQRELLDSGPPTGPRDTFFFMDVADAGKASTFQSGSQRRAKDRCCRAPQEA